MVKVLLSVLLVTSLLSQVGCGDKFVSRLIRGMFLNQTLVYEVLVDGPRLKLFNVQIQWKHSMSVKHFIMPKR
jgi:hypothetical protein